MIQFPLAPLQRQLNIEPQNKKLQNRRIMKGSLRHSIFCGLKELGKGIVFLRTVVSIAARRLLLQEYIR